MLTIYIIVLLEVFNEGNTQLNCRHDWSEFPWYYLDTSNSLIKLKPMFSVPHKIIALSQNRAKNILMLKFMWLPFWNNQLDYFKKLTQFLCCLYYRKYQFYYDQLDSKKVIAWNRKIGYYWNFWNICFKISA